jgi:RNA polymerase sigma-70 factor (ECF subfamily)
MRPRLPGFGDLALDNDQMPSEPPAAPVPHDWAQLYAQHRDAMWKVAVAVLHGSDRVQADAQDVINGAFLSVMNSPPAEVDNWEAFLVRATVNKAKDHLRKAEHRHTELAPAKNDDEIDSVEPPPADDTADIVIRRLQAATVRVRFMEAIDALPERQQHVVRLRILHSESIGSIATHLQTSPANVSQLLKKALQAITETLALLDEVNADDIEHIRPTRRRRGDG